MTFLILIVEFLKIGLFAFGGGYATIPFLYRLADDYAWFDREMLANMIAISESTPGPVGVNMATYAGYQAGGILGGVIATASLVVPSFILVVLVAKFLEKFKNSASICSIFYGLRPAVTGIIASAALVLLNLSVLTLDKFALTKNLLDLVDLKSLALFAVFLFLTNKIRRHPAFFIASAAVAGIVFKF